MISITSISGGKTSAYLAANYPTDYNLFALVRTSDPECRFKDEKLRRVVEDRIQKDFIGTLEDDKIVTTILDLEQFIGKEINWVSGITYDEVIEKKGGWLPNKLHRYCTTYLKIEPMFYWWALNIGEPVIMQIGFRANEKNRITKMQSRLNKNGMLTMKASFEKNARGQNKWEIIEWQKPEFPLYDDQIWKDNIDSFWINKPVKFADRNNCVGCFHRHPLLLKKMFSSHPEKMEWFAKQERKEKKGTWRSDVTYDKIKSHPIQIELDFDDFGDCDSGACEMY